MKTLLAAVAVNLLLMLAMALAAAPAGRKPPRPRDWIARQVTAAAPPPEAPRAEEAPPESPKEAPALQDPVPAPSSAEATPEAPPLRLDLPLFTPAAPLPAAPAIAAAPASLPSAGPVDLARADVAPQRLSTPLPPYPAWARSRRLEGSVTLRYTVDVNGAVLDLRVDEVTGDERFAEAAREAVARWRYEPGQVGGKRVPVVLLQTVRFQLVDR